MQMLIWAAAVLLLHYYQQIQTHKLISERAELEAQASRLELLQHQINPHFLFNVLGNMDTLMLKGKVEEARKMLNRLTRFLRATLSTTNSPQSTLELELHLVNSYLDIEKLRLGNRLDFSTQAETSTQSTMVPTGILIPLVENALKHGMIASTSGGYLHIKAHVVDQFCQIELTNDIGEVEQNNGFGLGLENVKRRLAHFDAEATSTEQVIEQDQFRFIIRVPT
jgi:two-component system LytT family sensor kinase